MPTWLKNLFVSDAPPRPIPYSDNDPPDVRRRALQAWRGSKYNVEHKDLPTAQALYKLFYRTAEENGLSDDEAFNLIEEYERRAEELSVRFPYEKSKFQFLGTNAYQALAYAVEKRQLEADLIQSEKEQELSKMARELAEEQFASQRKNDLDNAKLALLQTINTLHSQHDYKHTAGVTIGHPPFVVLMRNPKKFIADMVYALTTAKLYSSEFIYPYAPVIFRNLGIAAANENYDEKYLRPMQSKLDPVSLAKACFKDTDMEAKLMAPTPVQIPDQKRVEHWHILAKTGHGKTQTLHRIISQDLIRDDPPALVIIEPKGDITDPLSKLQLFADQPGRLTIIDPTKTPALNFFALPERVHEYPIQVRQLIIGKIAETYAQALASADTDISAPQRNALNNVVKLVFSMSGNIRDLLDILDDDTQKTKDASAYELSPYRPEIEKLDEWAIRFFKTQFYEGQFRISRRSLSSKLQGIIGSFLPFGEIFGAHENNLDLYELMETPGSVVLINTQKGILGEHASQFFGRLMVAQAMSAALQRGFLHSAKKPAYLIVDEAQDYFDESFQTILEQTRSMGVGLIFVHHNLAQIERFKSTALTHPSIKLVAPRDVDADTMAANMGDTEAEFFKGLKKVDYQYSEFGLFIENSDMQSAIKVKIEHGALKPLPKMNNDQHRTLVNQCYDRLKASPYAAQQKADPEPEKPTTTLMSAAPKSTGGKIDLGEAD